MKQFIENYMTHSPHTINAELPLEAAKKMMRELKIRHLPVQKSGRLVGILSERDVLLAQTLDRDGKSTINEVMTSEPYAVKVGTPLGNVVEEMTSHLYGCAVVCDEKGGVVGIFTALDGLREIADRMNTKTRKAEIAKGSYV